MTDRSALYRDLKRVGKARDFADVLQEAGATADSLFALDDVGWALATNLVAARRNKPVGTPSDATKALIWSRLVEREKPLGPSLLEGLPS